MFSENQIVICTMEDSGLLTKDQCYLVVEYTDPWVYVCDDTGRLQKFHKERFRLSKIPAVDMVAFFEAIANPPEVISSNEGIKHDQDKPDLSLLPREFLDEVAKAMQYGAQKYGRYNYRGGMDWHRIVAAGMRHLTAWNDGEDKDSESGLSHLGHAGACILMLCVLTKTNKGKDTRFKK